MKATRVWLLCGVSCAWVAGCAEGDDAPATEAEPWLPSAEWIVPMSEAMGANFDDPHAPRRLSRVDLTRGRANGQCTLTYAGVDGARSYRWVYDAQGRQDSDDVSAPDGMTTWALERDGRGMITTRERLAWQGGQRRVVSTERFTRREDGKLIAMESQEPDDPMSLVTNRYEYDLEGRLSLSWSSIRPQRIYSYPEGELSRVEYYDGDETGDVSQVSREFKHGYLPDGRLDTSYIYSEAYGGSQEQPGETLRSYDSAGRYLGFSGRDVGGLMPSIRLYVYDEGALPIRIEERQNPMLARLDEAHRCRVDFELDGQRLSGRGGMVRGEERRDELGSFEVVLEGDACERFAVDMDNFYHELVAPGCQAIALKVLASQPR